MPRTSHGRACWLGLCALLLGSGASGAEPGAPVTVFAAASLTNVLEDLGDAWTRASGEAVRFSFAASSSLARQIESGAPADLFFSADLEWMDYLAQRRLIQPATRHDLLGNRLVLIAPKDSTVTLKIKPAFALAQTLGTGRLATGDPDFVPAGRYAREALGRLGVWSQVESKLVRADSVRSALAFVDRGEAPLGIVYETDARVDPHVRIVDIFPEESHAPVVYPIALTTHGRPLALAFVEFLRSPAALPAFRRYGFTVLP